MLVDQTFKDKEIQDYFKNKILIRPKDIEFIKSKVDLTKFKLSDKDIKYHLKFNIPFCEHICPICGQAIHVDFKCLSFPCACSAHCRSILSKQKRENTMQQKYGKANPMQCNAFKLKQQQAVFDHYGVYTPAKNKSIVQKALRTKQGRVYKIKHKKLSEQTKQKIKDTLIKKYGVDCIFKSKQFIEKLKKDNLKKYNKEYFVQTEQFKKKYRDICLKRYGEDHFFKTKEGKLVIGLKTKARPKDSEFVKRMSRCSKQRIEARHKNTYNRIIQQSRKRLILPLFSLEEYKGDKYQTKYKWQCLKCGHIFKHYYANGQIPRCPNCERSYHDKENLFFEFIKVCTNEDIVRNTRTIVYPYELDIYIPNLNLAFEFNGNYWHSKTCKQDKNYHLNKTKLCEEKGIRLIHIFEWEWDKNKEYVKDRIRRILGNQETIFDKTNEKKENVIKISRAWQSKVNNVFLKNKSYKLIKETDPIKHIIPNGKGKPLEIYDCGYLVFSKLND